MVNIASLNIWDSLYSAYATKFGPKNLEILDLLLFIGSTSASTVSSLGLSSLTVISCVFQKIIFFPFVREDIFKEHNISWLNNHIYMNIWYFLFVYQKTVGIAIQEGAYENVVHRLRSQFSLLR